MTLKDLQQNNAAPSWLTEEGYKTLTEGYLLENETPREMYKRIARAAAKHLENPLYWEGEFFDAMWRNWLCPSTPVAANMGAGRGLPISCFGSYVPDSLSGIFDTVKEVATMSKYGGGTSGHMNDIRPAGAPIYGTGGQSSGVLSWAKVFDSTIMSVSQGSTRRGATALYLPIEHQEASAWMRIRRPEGDVNRHCPNIHHGVTISDDFMHRVQGGDKEARALWMELLKHRFETGEPYIFFSDAAQKDNPEYYKQNGLKVNGSNLCTEIFLATNRDNSFVCCLSSLNLARYDEWKASNIVTVAITFLDAIMTEFINMASLLSGMEKAVNFAKNSRALGLGVLGWHSLLQHRNIPFDSFEAMMLNNEVFRYIRQQADITTKSLAATYGEPEWMKGTGRRNTHLIAVAPTVSNSTISGNVSPGIEPIPANAYVKKTAKGAFIQYNPILKERLAEIGLDTEETWNKIVKNNGSVQDLSIPDKLKEVFQTAREINQFAIIKQAGQRQKWIDQGQSVNLFFAANSDPKYIHKVHMLAWESGLKSLYYLRSSSIIRGDMATRSEAECKACEG